MIAGRWLRRRYVVLADKKGPNCIKGPLKRCRDVPNGKNIASIGHKLAFFDMGESFECFYVGVGPFFDVESVGKFFAVTSAFLYLTFIASVRLIP